MYELKKLDLWHSSVKIILNRCQFTVPLNTWSSPQKTKPCLHCWRTDRLLKRSFRCANTFYVSVKPCFPRNLQREQKFAETSSRERKRVDTSTKTCHNATSISNKARCLFFRNAKASQTTVNNEQSEWTTNSTQCMMYSCPLWHHTDHCPILSSKCWRPQGCFLCIAVNCG